MCTPGGCILAGYYTCTCVVLMQMSHSYVSSNQKSLCSSHIFPFCKIIGVFWVYWSEIVFLKGLVEFMEMKNLEDLTFFQN